MLSTTARDKWFPRPADTVMFRVVIMRQLLLLLAALSFGQQRDDPARIRQAAALVEQQRWRDADELLRGMKPPLEFKQVIAFHRLRAAVASALGRKSEAAEEMRQALRFDAKNQDMILATAKVERAAQEYDGAVERLSGLPESALVLKLLGDIEQERGRFAEAEKAYRRAAELAPNEEQYRVDLAVSFLRRDEFDEARKVLAEMHSPRSRVLLGLAHYALGKDAEAAKALLEASDLEPGAALPVRILGELQVRASSAPDDAAVDRVCLWADRDSDPHAAALCGALVFRLARAAGDKGVANDVVERLSTAAKAAPQDATAQCELAAVYDWLGKAEDARAPSEACLRLQPPGAESRPAFVREVLAGLGAK